MTLTKRQILFALLSGLAFSVCVAWYLLPDPRIPRKIRNAPIHQRAKLIAHYREFGGLGILPGMTKEQVKQITGEPQNSNSKYVWAWGFNDRISPTATPTWQTLMHDGMIYVLFLDEKVVNIIPAIEVSSVVTPIELLMSISDCSEQSASRMLDASDETGNAK